MYNYILLFHVIAATIWTGGHLVLATRILPIAWRTKNASLILDFERRYEPIGLTSLAYQVISGFWMAQRLVPPSQWFSFATPQAEMIAIKIGCLTLTALLAIHAQTRVIPRLRDDNIHTLAFHIMTVTTLGVIFVAAGVGIRVGGWW